MSYLTAFTGLIVLRFLRVRGLYPLTLVALFIYVAFRFEVGCDWSGYLNQFQIFGARSWSEIWQDREPLWQAIIIVQTQLGLPYPWLNVAAAAIFFAGMHAMARRQPNPLAFLVLLFPILIINMPMSGIRQGAAIGVLGWAFTAFNDRRTWRFTLWVLVAASLHASAMVFLLLIPLAGGTSVCLNSPDTFTKAAFRRAGGGTLSPTRIGNRISTDYRPASEALDNFFKLQRN